MKRVALFPGSFDPFTKGHEDIVLRGLRLFDEVIVGIGHNSTKKRYFPVEMMKQLIEQTFEAYPAVSVVTYDDLTAKTAFELMHVFCFEGYATRPILSMKTVSLKSIDTSMKNWKRFF
jgi:pantetheine-phosphate adenylyltransferase